MRITQTLSKDEKTIYNIKLGYSEMLMLYEYARENLRTFPKNFEVSPARNRLASMVESMGDEIRKYRLDHTGYNPSDFIYPIKPQDDAPTKPTQA